MLNPVSALDHQARRDATEVFDRLTTGDLTWPDVSLGGVTELRVHGVGGTPATAMLGVVDPVQVSGDRTAGMWRSRHRHGEHDRFRVEAYSWGGLNGRGLRGALWLLALPFARVNLAGWMAPERCYPMATAPAWGRGHGSNTSDQTTKKRPRSTNAPTSV